ncbi:titin-like [Chrysoperla carnea]|uniref:titin-like n=1 Tax=Chrysoperla carnea TaxID=189513 RepID=UPI001D0800BE|nr:titin-like [Chrysoperla carnea]XP_044730547.1 titin-like [Chrysoperla carnea]
MCDQSSVQYNDGDVVWVKLGPCWWPGEVHDIKRVPPEIQPGLKKPPIAYVHFFQEDKYEYVRSLDYIYHYNCRRKHEFIKKGLDMHRAKQKHMDKFPVDVCTAETLTNGDPDIITSEEFAPQQKVSYANLFGSPANRKSTSMKRISLGGSGGKPGRGRKSGTPKLLATSTPTRFINPLLNNKKYEAHDLTKGVDTSLAPAVSDNSTNVILSCDRCNYTCTRINVIAYHIKMHIAEDNGTILSGKGKKKSKSKMSPQNKLSKISRCSTLTIDEDLELLRKGIDLSTYDYQKKKYKSPKIKFAKTLKLTEKKKNSKKDTTKGISNLLADWDDSGSEKEEDNTVKSVDTSLNETGISELQASQTEEGSKTDTTAEKSCFDFEEDEEVATIISKSPGRKIPRVIPENQKAKTPETGLDISNDMSTEPKSALKEVDNVDKTIKGKRNRKSKVEFEEMTTQIPDYTETIEKQFDQIMAETALPELTLLTTESTPLLSDTKTPDKKSRVRKKYELFSKDKSPISSDHKESDSETIVNSDKKVRGKKKSEISRTEISTEQQESEKETDKNLTSKDESSHDKNKSESDNKVLESELHEPRGKRRLEIKNKVVEKQESSIETDQESHKKKVENEEKVSESIQPKHESTHATRGKRKSELIPKEKLSEDIEQVEPSSKKRADETKLIEITEQKETRGRQKSESSSKEKISNETPERKETRGRKKSVSPMKEMKVVEVPVLDQKESELKSKKSKSDFKEKSPELKLEKLFSEKPEKKIRGRKSTPVIDKLDENVVETIAHVNELSNVVDLGKKTRHSKKFEPVQIEPDSEPFSESLMVDTSSKKLLPKRRGLSTVIPKDFKDIYNKSDSLQTAVKDNEKIEENLEILSQNKPQMETELTEDIVKSKSEEKNQDVKELTQETKTDAKSDTPKRSRRQTKTETPKAEIKDTNKEEFKTDIQEKAGEIKVDKKSKRQKTEKISESNLELTEEIVESKTENKRSRRSQKIIENFEDKTELKVDSKDENIESKSDNKRSRRSQKLPETEELKKDSAEEKAAEDKSQPKLDDNIDSKSDSKKIKKLSNKSVENLEEKQEEIKIDIADENKRSTRSHKPTTESSEDKQEELKIDNVDENKRSRRSHKTTEAIENKSEESKTDSLDDNKRSRRSYKLVESLEEKSDELKIDTMDENKRSRRSLKISESLEGQSEELKIDSVDDNKRSRRSNKPAESVEDRSEELKIDIVDENKRSRRSQKLAENLEDKPEELKIGTVDDNKRSKRLNKSADILEENSEELKIDTVDDNKRSRRSHKATENLDDKTEEFQIDTIDENKRTKKSTDNLEHKDEELKIDTVDDNKRSRRSYKPSETLEDKPEELKTDIVDENKRSRRSHKLVESVEEKSEELLKIDNVEETKRSRKSHKSLESLEGKSEELKIDTVDENKRSRRSHKLTENIEDKPEEIKIDIVDENKRSKRSQKLTENLEDKPEELIVDSVDESKRSKRSHKPIEIFEEKPDELKIDTIQENKRLRKSHKPAEILEENSEDIKIDTVQENKRSRKSHKPVQNLEEKSEELKIDTIDENKRSTRSLKPAEIVVQKAEELKIDVDESKQAKKSHKAAESLEEKARESKIDTSDETKRSKKSHKSTDNLEEKAEESKIDTFDESKRSRRSQKPAEIAEEKIEFLKIEASILDNELKIDNKRSRRSLKLPETVVEESKLESTEEKIDIKLDNKRVKRGAYKQSDSDKLDEFKPESIDENKPESKRLRTPSKSFEILEDKTVEVGKDKVEATTIEIVEKIEQKSEPKPDKRSRKQKMEYLKDDESKADDFGSTSTINKLDDNLDILVQKSKTDSPRKSKRYKADSAIVENLNESVLLIKDTASSLTMSSNKLETFIGSDIKRHKSPMKELHKFDKNKADAIDESVKNLREGDNKNETANKVEIEQKLILSPKKDEIEKEKLTLSPKKDEIGRIKLILSPKKDEIDKAKLIISPKKDETDKGKLILSPKKDEVDKINVILSPKQDEQPEKELIEKPRERLRILRKRGRFSYSSPSHSSKELIGTDDVSDKTTANESSNVSAYTFQENTGLTDSLLHIKKPSFSYREASAKAALTNENKLKEQSETLFEKTFDEKPKDVKSPTKLEKEKSDDSVKVMISLNDFKMEDIPLPPTPSQSTSSPLKITFRDKRIQEAEKSDTCPNTSQELKRTPIKFEISKMKAQINKKLITTHKSFLAADDDDENKFPRKIQPLHSETTSSKRTNEKECEAPKKRVMADYKKELDMEKTKEREEQERKMLSENQFKAKEDEITDTKVLLDENKSTEGTALNLVAEVDIEKDEVMVIDKSDESTIIESKKQDEQITSPLKHEDISAVINSGSEVKIIDSNSENYEDKDKIVQQIVHETSVETTSVESILEPLESNEINTTPSVVDVTHSETDTTSSKIDTTPKNDEVDILKNDENIKELQNVLESKDTNETLFNELTKSDDQLLVAEIQEGNNKDDTSAKLPLTPDKLDEKLDTSTKVVTTTAYEDELESIENEIQKITSSESSPCKANIFPENIALMSTPTKDNISMSDSLIDNKDLYAPQLSESEQNTSLLLSTETTKTTDNENSIESEIAKLTDTKPEEDEIIPEQAFSTTSSKLLEILESKGDKTKVEKKLVPVTLSDRKQTFVGLTAAQKRTVSLGSKFGQPKATKFVIKSSPINKDTSSTTKKPKPIILSEEIIKPANNDLKTPPTKGVATKRNFEEDIEDKGGIKKFIIEKAVADSSTPSSNKASRIKPTVLSQTIITSTGKIIDGSLETNKESVDDNMFDINSMPIVLSDDLLTPESIENMPIVLSNEPEKSNTVQIMNKSGKVIPEKMKIISQQKPMIKSVVHQGIAKNQKIYQTSSTKLLSNKTAVITQPGKPEKFIILPSSSANQTTGSKYTVGKRQIRTPGQSSIVVSKSLTGVSPSGSPVDTKPKLQSGNKVMVVTNAQGQQSRIILSPAQQRMLGTKMGTKIVARGSPVTKGTTLSLNNIVTSKGAILTPTSTLVQTKTQTGSPQTVVTSKGQLLTSVHSQSIITSKGQILTPVTPTQMKALKSGVQGTKKIQLHSQKIIIPAGSTPTKSTLPSIPGAKTKTVLVKGQRHIVQKVQPNTSTPPGQLRTVVQKSPALKTISTPTSISPVITGKQKLTIAPKTPNVIKRQIIRQQGTPSQQPQRIILQKMSSSDVKTPSPVQRPPQQKLVEQKQFIKSTRPLPSPIITSSQSVPPLVPLSSSQPKTTESTLSQSINIEPTPSISSGDTSVHSPKQLIIQDDMGNQTSITQGQILAVPGGEVVDGQPQSYMLVTVDESGNLLPLDNQALMALDPNLIGPDGNVMLQFNQGLNTSTSDTSTALTQTTTDVLSAGTETEIPKKQTDMLSEATNTQDYQQLLITDDQQNLIALGAEQQLLMTDNQNLILADQTVLQDPKVTLPASDQAVTYSIANAEDGQQIFISGDPEKAQHLINALASGSQDLSQIMSGTEGNLIINADGQHIILNTESAAGAEQIILATSTDGFALSENYTPDFATQVTTNQDILAAALANTVFPQESAITEGLNIVTSATGGPLMSTTSELSPSLYQNMQLPNLPSGAVLETSLTNLAPIMSPLEVPTSGTSKKVPLDIETTSQVPKSLELPITITDPNIAQTVNSQLANELQTNLGLPITITDPNISNVRNSELTTSTFGYSLPNIEDSVQVSGTSSAGPISMPLLTEDLESETAQLQKSESAKNKDNEIETQPEELTNIFEPSETNSQPNKIQVEEIENSGNGLDVLASVTTASGMINVAESNSELEHIFAEKKDDQQLPANVFAQNPSFDNDIDENKETNNENTMHHHPHDDEDSFSRSQLTDHFVLGSPHSEIDANSDEISIQPSIVTEEGNNSNQSLSERSTNSLKRGFDGLEEDDECDDNKKSKFDIS